MTKRLLPQITLVSAPSTAKPPAPTHMTLTFQRRVSLQPEAYAAVEEVCQNTVSGWSRLHGTPSEHACQSLRAHWERTEDWGSTSVPSLWHAANSESANEGCRVSLILCNFSSVLWKSFDFLLNLVHYLFNIFFLPTKQTIWDCK